MGRVLMTGAGGGGGSSDDCTASANDILKGKTAVYNGSDDDIGAGTLELTGSATDGYVYSGKTYYNTDAHTMRTGTMTVGSILNFSAAAYSGRQVLLKWQNPYAAAGKPFGGVFINYSTSGYPGTGGTRIYTGYGNNSSSGGWSQVIVTMPNLGTTYYFSCTAYVPCSAGDIWGNTMNGACTTANSFTVTITSSQNYTIPDGYSYVDIFCVGGGGGGGCGDYDTSSSNAYGYGGGGACGGYTSVVSNVSVSSGQVLYCAIGNGGSGGTANSKVGGTGGTTYVSRNGSWLCSAAGGSGGWSDFSGYNGKGGSGGAGVAGNQSDRVAGTNGGNGTGTGAGSGQGTTTRPFGESSGTIYSGGGGSGGAGRRAAALDVQNGSSGGNYGGGNGGDGARRTGGSSSEGYTYGEAYPGASGVANSGGGGGGGGGNVYSYVMAGGAGGSGIILLRVK